MGSGWAAMGGADASEKVVMDAAEQLLAVEEIKRVKARYFRCMDTKDWEGFAQVFAADAVMDMSEEAGAAPGDLSHITRGAADIAAMAQAGMEGVQTVHHGHMPEIYKGSGTMELYRYRVLGPAERDEG